MKGQEAQDPSQTKTQGSVLRRAANKPGWAMDPWTGTSRHSPSLLDANSTQPHLLFPLCMPQTTALSFVAAPGRVGCSIRGNKGLQRVHSANTPLCFILEKAPAPSQAGINTAFQCQGSTGPGACSGGGGGCWETLCIFPSPTTNLISQRLKPPVANWIKLLVGKIHYVPFAATSNW